MTPESGFQMKLFCSILMILLHKTVCINESVYEYYRGVNVRTVLYDSFSIRKSCWPKEDIGLLLNRYIFQGLLPMTKSPTDVDALFQYIMWTLDILNDEATSARAKKLLLTALADTFGGYLQEVGLPIANELFYEGNIDTIAASSLHTLQKFMLCSLRTDGKNWACPLIIKNPILTIEPLLLTQKEFRTRCNKKVKFCDELIYDKPNRSMFSKSRSPKRSVFSQKADTNKKESVPDKKDDSNDKHKEIRRNKKTQNKTGNKSDCNLGIYELPLPFYDDNTSPSAIAIPLRENSLYKLTSNDSIGVFVKYYKTAVYCLNEQCSTSDDDGKCDRSLKEFHVQLYFWMLQNVLPHLQNGREFYPAYYEVLRVFRVIDMSMKDDPSRISSTSFTCGNMFPDSTGFFSKISSLIFLLILLLLLCIIFRFCYCTIRRTTEDGEVLDESGEPESIGSKFCGYFNRCCGNKSNEEDCEVPEQVKECEN